MKAKLKLIILWVVAAIFCGSGPAAAQTSSTPNSAAAREAQESNMLIAYFSHSGNTRSVAHQIQALAGGDLFEVVTVEPYPSEYTATTEVAKKELNSGHRPPLTAQVANMASYDTVFIGYPNWWGTMPMAMFTFLEQYDFSGKTIIPFCTHEGSRLGRSVDDLAQLAPRAVILKGFEIRGSGAAGAGPRLQTWLKELGRLK